jgi:hypothetical protein
MRRKFECKEIPALTCAIQRSARNKKVRDVVASLNMTTAGCWMIEIGNLVEIWLRERECIPD